MSRLGEGGQAAVFGVLDRRLGVARALKALLPELARRPKLRNRFESEARTMASLEHPNIVRVFDVSARGRTVWFVMEHVPGGNLAERIDRGGPLPPALAVRTLVQLCSGVAAAHARGIVHRDIKPQNALVTKDGTVKLVDFGIARTAEGHRTRAHAALGTLGYVSPEQLLDARSVDGRADVYSLGVTLFVLLTAVDPNEWLRRRRHDRVPEVLRAVIERATREEPAERHPTVEALAAELEACLPRLPADPPGATLADPSGSFLASGAALHLAGSASGGSLGGAPVLRREVEDPTPLSEVASWFDPATDPGDPTSEEAPAPPRAESTSWMTPGPPSPRVRGAELPGWIAAEPAPPPLHKAYEITLEPTDEREASEEARHRATSRTSSIEASFAPDGSVRLDPRIFVALAAVVLAAALLVAGGAYAAHTWQLAQAEDLRQVHATAQLRREVEAQRQTAALLIDLGADGARLDALYRDFDAAGEEHERLRAAEAIGAELHREADRVLVEGTGDAGRVESALRGLDRALMKYREVRPEP